MELDQVQDRAENWEVDAEFIVEEVDPHILKPHPRNYQKHPQDQIEHLKASLRKHGPFRNIVICRGDYILAGHGITEAAVQLGMRSYPAKRYDLDKDDPRALDLMAADNETGNLAERDERGLVGILREVSDDDPSALLGTGFDSMMLSSLEMVVRPPDDIRAHNEADHWVGLPAYEPASEPFKVIVQFDSDADRKSFLALIDADDPEYHMTQTRRAISTWWPPRVVKTDRKNAKWEGAEESPATDPEGEPPEEPADEPTPDMDPFPEAGAEE